MWTQVSKVDPPTPTFVVIDNAVQSTVTRHRLRQRPGGGVVGVGAVGVLVEV